MYTHEKEKNQVKIKVSYTKEEFEGFVEKAYQKTKSKYKVQGFRPGKTPRKIIEKTYGEQIFYDDAIEEAIATAYYEFLAKEKDLEIVSEPSIEIESLDEKGLKACVKVDILPEVELGAYKGLEFKKKKAKITEEDVQRELDKVLSEHARFIEKDEPAKLGDFVIIDFEGYLDGKKFDGGSSKAYRLELGSHSFIDGFEEQLVGAKKDEERDINVTFPVEYHAEELKGKPALFKVKVNSVEVKELPKLDDNFASDVSEFDTLDEYKKSIKDKLTEKEEKRNNQELEDDIIKTIAKSSKIDIPMSMIERQIDAFMDDLAMRLSYQGMRIEDYAKYTNTTIEDMRKSKHAQAEEYVKIRLCLEKIIKENNLMVTEDELDKKIKEYAESIKKPVEEYRKQLQDRDLAYIENDILMEKLFAFLKLNNKIN